MVRIIRESKDYIHEISRVAEVDGKIVGAVYYTKAWIDDGKTKREVALLGPLAVEPTMEGNGIGGALISESIRLAKKTNIPGIILAGEPTYYPKFGFEQCGKYGITDADGNSYDAYLCYPLTDEFKSCRGKFIESKDFEKIEDEKLLEKISGDFPSYRKVKVQEGFMQIFNEHLGVVESLCGDVYNVRYWELVIPARLSDKLKLKPKVGSDVQFYWNHKGGESTITKVIKNLLEVE
ncbi:MAG: N-acetyltransferase [Treponema sp.]|nr:N-acetyltransferase [Treponema sp.]